MSTWLAFCEYDSALPEPTAALAAQGHTVEVCRAWEYAGPWVRKPTASDRTLADIIQFQAWQEKVADTGAEMHSFQRYPRPLEEVAGHWFEVAGWYLDATAADGLLTWGCRGIMTRAAIHAATARGVRAVCVEEGWLPLPEARRTLSIERNLSYYARSPEDLSDWLAHETNTARISWYHDWFIKSRRTKGLAWGVGDWPMPSEYAGEPMGLGGMPGDASLYWCGGDACGAEEEMRGDLAERRGWWKPHPRKTTPEAYVEGGLRPIGAQTSIHSVFAADPECVAAVCSGALLEAWLYGLPTACYGRPGFCVPELTGRTVAEAAGHDQVERWRFLDWLLFEGPLVDSRDTEGIVRRILG